MGLGEINWIVTFVIIVLNIAALIILWGESGRKAKEWYWLNRELSHDNRRLKEENESSRARIRKHIDIVEQILKDNNFNANALLQSLYIASQEDSDFDVAQALAKFKKRTVKNKLTRST